MTPALKKIFRFYPHDSLLVMSIIIFTLVMISTKPIMVALGFTLLWTILGFIITRLVMLIKRRKHLSRRNP